MSLIELDLIEELFTPAQKRQIAGELNDAMFALKHEYRHWLPSQQREAGTTNTARPAEDVA